MHKLISIQQYAHWSIFCSYSLTKCDGISTTINYDLISKFDIYIINYSGKNIILVENNYIVS